MNKKDKRLARSLKDQAMHGRYGPFHCEKVRPAGEGGIARKAKRAQRAHHGHSLIEWLRLKEEAKRIRRGRYQ